MAVIVREINARNGEYVAWLYDIVEMCIQLDFGIY